MESLTQQSRILLAEDCPDTQKVLQFMLEQTGAEVVLAGDGAECVEKAHNGDFQLIVLDIKMPKLDGVEALRELRKDGFSNPVVALTAAPSEETKSRMEALGIDAYLSKLADRKNIVSTVEEILERSESGAKPVPLPVLPVYPEVMPQTVGEFESLIGFLDQVRFVGRAMKQALKRQAYGELDDCVIALREASLHGYEVLASQLRRLQEALDSEHVGTIFQQATAVHRLLLGILEGRKKIERKASLRGISNTDGQSAFH